MPAEAAAILVALGAGLLIGVERERRKGDDSCARGRWACAPLR